MKGKKSIALILVGTLGMFCAQAAYASESPDATTSETPTVEQYYSTDETPILPLLGPEFTTASTRSSQDTGWSFSMKFHGTDGVLPRKKDNNSSVYIYVQYKNMDRYNVYVDGVEGESGSGRVACTDNGEAYVYRVGEFLISNWVHERRKPYAQLTGYASYEGGSTGGLWSPDSVGKYPYINKDL